MPDTPTPTRRPPGARSLARQAALQALYQWLQADTEAGELVLQFQRGGLLSGAENSHFRRLVRGVIEQADALEPLFAEFVDRRPAQLDPVERALLLMAVLELRDCPQVPYRVVINEAVDLAKRFGGQDSHRYINGVLDKAARQLRPLESGAPPAE